EAQRGTTATEWDSGVPAVAVPDPYPIHLDRGWRGWLRLFLLCAAVSPPGKLGAADPTDAAFARARTNAVQSNEGYVRSLRLTQAWLDARDPVSGLIPSRLKGEPKTDRTDVWEPHNAAADNYAFMALTASLLDRRMFDREMTAMLGAERKLTSR